MTLPNYNFVSHSITNLGHKAVRVEVLSYIATLADEVIVANKATAMSVTLPAATGSGKPFTIASINIGPVTLACNGAETVNGDATQTLYQWESMQVVDYAAGVWVVV